MMTRMKTKEKLPLAALPQKKIKQPEKLVAAVHQKRSQMRSNKQALSELARAMQNMAESQTKRLKMTLEAEEKREEKKETRTTGRSGEKPKTQNRDSKNLRSSKHFS